MINWIIVLIFAILGLILLQLEHHTRKIKAVIIAILGLTLYFSLMGLINSEGADLSSPRTIINTVYSYFGWIGETSTKLWDIGQDTVALVGNAVKVNSTEEEIR